MDRIHIGTSGWVYKHWANVFYPAGLKEQDKLKYYSQYFKTVEINSSFYHLPKETTFTKWREMVPANFIFAVKGWGLITHRLRLRNSQEAVNTFLDKALHLEEKLGPVLWQLPPSLKYDKALIENFLNILPKNLKYAIEVRHPSFVNKEFFGLLKTFNIAFCIADTPKFPYAEEITADFVYIRLHGHDKLYGSLYSKVQMQAYAQKIKNWKKETYVYFDNDEKGYAIQNSLELIELTEG